MKKQSSTPVKVPAVKKTIVKKKAEHNVELVSAFAKAYAKILSYICHYWIHDFDGVCDHDYVGRRQVLDCDLGLKVTYSPQKHDGCWAESAAVILTIPKTIRVNKRDEVAMESEVRRINSLLVDDFKSILDQSGGKWFRPIKAPYQTEQILEIYAPFEKRESRTWILKFEPSYVVEGVGSCGWYPLSVESIFNPNVKDNKELISDLQEKGTPQPRN